MVLHRNADFHLVPFRAALKYLLGRFPREVHMHVRRHDIKDLPADDEGLQEVRSLTLFLRGQNILWEWFFSWDY